MIFASMTLNNIAKTMPDITVIIVMRKISSGNHFWDVCSIIGIFVLR